MKVSQISDIQAIEAQGFDASYPHKTPWDMIQHHAAHNPNAIAIHYLHDASDPSQDIALTYATLAQNIMGAARLFRRSGVTPDHSITLLTQHTPSAQAALWGA